VTADLLSHLPHDTTVVVIPVDREALPQFAAVIFKFEAVAPPPPAPVRLPLRALGIDASRYQEAIHWPQVVSEGGVKFALLKCTEGAQYTDPTFADNWRKAKDAGVLRGAYHFFRPDVPNPDGELARIQSVLRDDWGELGLWVDVERPTFNGAPVDPARYAATIERDLRRLLELLETQRPGGATLGIYTGAGFWDSTLPGAIDLLNRYPAWIANYPFNYTDTYKPRLPRGMAATQLRIWQFDNGEMPWSKKVAGINNRFGHPAKVDKNFWMAA